MDEKISKIIERIKSKIRDCDTSINYQAKVFLESNKQEDRNEGLKHIGHRKIWEAALQIVIDESR